MKDRTPPARPSRNASRLPPAGHFIGAGRLARLLWRADRWPTDQTLGEAVRDRLGSGQLTLHASGRAALLAGLRTLAEGSGRNELLVPAYTCYSVPAAGVAAGLRIRLVDVDGRGRIDRHAFEKMPLDRAVAVVVSNLFGLPEPIGDIAERAHESGCAVVDDAAQSLGARDDRGPVGARGDLGILSFGRGKPLSALGGGAAWWPGAEPLDPATTGPTRPSPTSRLQAFTRAIAYDLALVAPVFRALAAIPALHIGETSFDPDIQPDPIAGFTLPLLEVGLHEFDRQRAERARTAEELARRVEAVTAWRAVVGAAGVSGVYPRLALIAPTEGARNRAWAQLRGIESGASLFYPQSLDTLAPLRPHRVDTDPCPGARDLATRLLTLPTHGRLAGRRLHDTLTILAHADG